MKKRWRETMKQTKLMERYEEETGEEAQAFYTPGISPTRKYVLYLERLVNEYEALIAEKKDAEEAEYRSW